MEEDDDDDDNSERQAVLVVTANKIYDIHVGVLKVLGQVLYGICCGPHSIY
jgi:hypothetical protein